MITRAVKSVSSRVLGITVVPRGIEDNARKNLGRANNVDYSTCANGE